MPVNLKPNTKSLLLHKHKYLNILLVIFPIEQIIVDVAQLLSMK